MRPTETQSENGASEGQLEAAKIIGHPLNPHRGLGNHAYDPRAGLRRYEESALSKELNSTKPSWIQNMYYSR
jgi:hypothetical protein